MPEPQRSQQGKGIRFIATGLLVNLSLLVVLEAMLRTGLDYRVAVTVSYLLGMIWGYAQNRLWSWQSNAPLYASFTRYIAIYAVIYVLHLLFVMLLVDGLSVRPLLAAIISAAVLVVPIFFLLDRVVFASKSS